MYRMSEFWSLLLMFFATLLRALGLGRICVGMSGSRILLPCRFVRGLSRVLCSGHERASTNCCCCADAQACPKSEKFVIQNSVRPESTCTTVAEYLVGSCYCTCTRILPRCREERHLQGVTVNNNLSSCESGASCRLAQLEHVSKSSLHALPPNMPSLPPSLTLCAGQAMLSPGIQILTCGSINLRNLQ